MLLRVSTDFFAYHILGFHYIKYDKSIYEDVFLFEYLALRTAILRDIGKKSLIGTVTVQTHG